MSRLRRILSDIAIAAITFLFLTAVCRIVGLVERGSDAEVIAPVISRPDPLNGTRWQLMAFESEAEPFRMPERPNFFVRFRKGGMSLEGGCNRVSGHYVIEDDQIMVTFARSTLINCGPKVNRIEDAFSDALPTFESYTIEDDQLRIRYAEGTIRLRRARRGCNAWWGRDLGCPF